MTTPPPKTKPRPEWSVEEIVQHGQTGIEPVSDEWRSYVADVARAAGVEPQDLGLDDETDRPLDDLDVAGHIDRIRRDR